MRTMLLFVLFLLTSNLYSQEVHIDTLPIPFPEPGADTLYFPQIRTGNTNIDSLINWDLKNRATYGDFESEPVEVAIRKWSEFYRVWIYEFTVTNLTDGVISLNIIQESCNAYCTQWIEYYNYSVETGKFLTMADIVDDFEAFSNMVKKDRWYLYQVEMAELKDLYDLSELEMDQALYESLLEDYRNCEQRFKLEKFSVFPNRLEIFEEACLPHVVRAFEPSIYLVYNKSDISKYINDSN